MDKMGDIIVALPKSVRVMLVLWLALCACACTQADARQFDVPAQPAASALNEFARQADITLIFSYDLVTGIRTRTLRGRYAVNEGLTRLLKGTDLQYRRVGNGAYLICRRASCEAASNHSGDKGGMAETAGLPVSKGSR
jgi:hypothetical protein